MGNSGLGTSVLAAVGGGAAGAFFAAMWMASAVPIAIGVGAIIGWNVATNGM